MNSASSHSPFSRQQGVTMIVSLIMLILITLLAVASFRLGKSDLQIAGNMQQRKQALSAAQQTIEQVISSTQFTTTPTNALPNPCGGVANTACVDVNGDGVIDINVGIVMLCSAIEPILTSTLNLSNPNDAGCAVGAGQNTGVAGASTNNSMCSNSIWDAQATATDVVTNAQYVIDQGVAIRVPSSSVCP
jgi:Tfp pilus assembly protein PilX